ncbi:MAG: branched-chain amino acid ABC transporter permease [Elusimicrobia bacterium]|nr:branched-chain amino acid ABC transporter permease [Elusimicrobiota bacterium]
MRAWKSLLPFVLGLPVLWLIQLWAPPQIAIILVNIGVNVILAVSLNMVNGFTGQFSLGHAGFMAVGAYTAAKITLAFGESASVSPLVWNNGVFFIALLAGMGMAAFMGLLVGIPSLRLRGDYLAIVTLGFNEIIRVLIENMSWLGGATGISGVPPYTSLIWVGLGVLAAIVTARRLLLSTHGRALLAIREDEVAAEAMGVDTTGYKVRAFVLSAAFAGLGGGLLGHYILLVTPKSFTYVKSIEVVVMVVLGGMGSISGAVFAAVLLTSSLELLRGVDQYRMVIYSLLLVVLMLSRPTGLFGHREVWDFAKSWRRKRAEALS